MRWGWLWVITLAMSVWAGAVPRQDVDVPPGVVYKKAPEATNQKAKAKLAKALLTPADKVDLKKLFGEAFVCGPYLWERIKKEAPVTLQKGIPSHFIIGPKRVQKDGRTFKTAAQIRRFWQTFLKSIQPDKALVVRKALRSELEYFWATIPFDIEEPLYVAVCSKTRVLFLFDPDKQEPKVMWVDIAVELEDVK